MRHRSCAEAQERGSRGSDDYSTHFERDSKRQLVKGVWVSSAQMNVHAHESRSPLPAAQPSDARPVITRFFMSNEHGSIGVEIRSKYTRHNGE